METQNAKNNTKKEEKKKGRKTTKSKMIEGENRGGTRVNEEMGWKVLKESEAGFHSFLVFSFSLLHTYNRAVVLWCCAGVWVCVGLMSHSASFKFGLSR